MSDTANPVTNKLANTRWQEAQRLKEMTGSTGVRSVFTK
jgi:hypothetical protein